MAFKDFLYRHVTAIDITAALVILLMVMSNVYFVLEVNQLQSELANARYGQKTENQVEGVISFMDMFIDDVLRAEGEIDFETRLKLESSVRALEDEQVLLRWQAFTGAETEKDAQDAVKELLGVLSERIRVGTKG